MQVSGISCRLLVAGYLLQPARTTDILQPGGVACCGLVVAVVFSHGSPPGRACPAIAGCGGWVFDFAGNKKIHIFVSKYIDIDMEFKRLEIEEKQGLLRRLVSSGWLRRTAIFTIAGAAGGFLFYLITIGMDFNLMDSHGIIEHVLIGSFAGFFLTNSPCARGRC